MVVRGLSLLWLVFAVACSKLECDEEPSLDVLHHAVELSVRLAPPSLIGHGVVRAKTRRETRSVALDARALRISRVAMGSKVLEFAQSADRVCIRLPSSVPAQREISLELAWQATPTADGALRVTTNEVWAGYLASAWMPTIQDPAQRATLSLRIATTHDLKVAASGRAIGLREISEDLRVHAFELERPSPPFLYGFAAGRFEVREIAVGQITFRGLGRDASELADALEVTARSYRAIADRLDAQLPAAEYTQIFVQGGAAQEAAGIAFVGSDSLARLRTDPQDDWVFTHELAHQWFGWQLPCADFADFWLNEGFATFLVGIAKEAQWGADAYASELSRWRVRSQKAHDDGHDAPVSLSAPGIRRAHPVRENELQSRGITYFRGALVLDALRRDLGDDGFWAGIRRYVKDNRGKSVRTENLKNALEAATGRDLGEFFARHVYGNDTVARFSRDAPRDATENMRKTGTR